MNIRTALPRRHTAHTLVWITLAALAVRAVLVPVESGDYRDFLHPWFEELRTYGGLAAVGRPVGNYMVTYIYILALLTHLPLPELVSIKLVSVLGDVLLALVCRRFARSVTDSKRAADAAYAAALFLPSVVLNSAAWAQCDSLYTTALIACLLHLHEDRPARAMLAFSVGFVFKLQSVFLAPVLLAALVLFLLAPNRGAAARAGIFDGLNCAHRGLHSKDRTVPENSLPAFRAAAESGYGIELDVQLSSDEAVVVFHDDTLDRVCGVHGCVDAFSLEELRAMRLCGTQEGIPLFTEVLETVAGRSPLIVELKTGPRNDLLCRKTLEILRAYDGPFCIESFDPRCLIWLRKNRPEIIRGQLSSQFLRHGETAGHGKLTMWLLGNLMTNIAVQPDFIAYRFQDRKNPALAWCRKFYKVQEIDWTIRTKEEMQAAEQEGNLVIFECFDPRA